LKILFISNSFWNLYNFRKNLILKSSKKNKVFLIGNKDSYQKKFKKKNINFFVTSLYKNNLSVLNDFKYLISIIKYIKKIKPDNIISFTIKPNLASLIISKILCIPTIVTISGLGTLFLRYNLLFKCYLIILKFLINKKVIIFFHNKSDQLIFRDNDLIKKALYSKIVFGSGIDFKKFKYSKKNFFKNNFIFIGRLIKEKGIEELLAVIPEIKKKNPSVKFRVIGEIDKKNPRTIDQHKLYSLVKKGYIEYSGFKNDLTIDYQKATCLILPSYREGLSKTLMEGMTTGLPIITTNVPGCEDLVKTSSAGLIAKVKNKSSLKNQIQKFINFSVSKKKVMSINACNFAKKNFDEKQIINEYINGFK
jgi:glycosyltransferase involved in cell wall biosynthesis